MKQILILALASLSTTVAFSAPIAPYFCSVVPRNSSSPGVYDVEVNLSVGNRSIVYGTNDLNVSLIPKGNAEISPFSTPDVVTLFVSTHDKDLKVTLPLNQPIIFDATQIAFVKCSQDRDDLKK